MCVFVVGGFENRGWKAGKLVFDHHTPTSKKVQQNCKKELPTVLIGSIGVEKQECHVVTAYVLRSLPASIQSVTAHTHTHANTRALAPSPPTTTAPHHTPFMDHTRTRHKNTPLRPTDRSGRLFYLCWQFSAHASTTFEQAHTSDLCLRNCN